MESVRREIPDSNKRELRYRNLLNEFEVTVDRDDLPAPGFEPGNKKTGTSGGHFNNVIVWNVPPATTCPGASDWCLSVCYNGDDRPEVFEKNKWRSNIIGFNEDANLLGETLQQEIDALEHPLAVRIHSSGDFFSKEYIDFWKKIVDDNPSVTFWAYTRSWAVQGLLEPLEELRQKENIQLFASWDETMVDPPEDWRVSYVKDENGPDNLPTNLTKCPEEFIEDMNCARCGFCLRNVGRGVLFNAH